MPVSIPFTPLENNSSYLASGDLGLPASLGGVWKSKAKEAKQAANRLHVQNYEQRNNYSFPHNHFQSEHNQ